MEVGGTGAAADVTAGSFLFLPSITKKGQQVGLPLFFRISTGRKDHLFVMGEGTILDIPLFSFLAHLAALFSIRVFCGFLFSSLFLSCPFMLSTPSDRV